MVQPTAIDYDQGRIYEPMTWTHDTDGRRRRDSKTAMNSQPPPRYDAHSPSRITSYSPTNGNHPKSPYQQFSSRPSTSSAAPIQSAHSPPRASLPSPKMNGASNHSAIFEQRESVPSFYDAVSDHREGQASWNPHYHVSSPTQVRLFSGRLRVFLSLMMFATNSEAMTEPRSYVVRWVLSRSSYLAQHLSFSHERTIPPTFSNGADLACAPAKSAQLRLTVSTTAYC